MSHIISLKVTKFQQHLLITVGVADEKPEGAKKQPPPPPPPRKIGLRLQYLQLYSLQHGLFTNGWETRSRHVWKPVSNRTPGIISKICKLGGGTPATVCSGLLGPHKISHGLIWGKWLQLDKMKMFFKIYTWCLLYFSEGRLAWLWVSLGNFSFMLIWWSFQVRALHNFHSWDTVSK